MNVRKRQFCAIKYSKYDDNPQLQSCFPANKII